MNTRHFDLKIIHLRIRGDLIIFLNKCLEKEDIKVDVHGYETVKHIIESIGIPHTEVGEVFVNFGETCFVFEVFGARHYVS